MSNIFLFQAANTPITLGAVSMILYILCQIFSLVGLYPVSNLLNLLMMITFCLLGAWGYIRYSGNGSDIGSNIDTIAITIWDSALMPVMNILADQGAHMASQQAMKRLNSTTETPAMSKKRK